MEEIWSARLSSLVFVAAAACGGGSGGDPTPGLVHSAEARTSVAQLGRISASMSAMNAADVFRGILVWGSATNRVVTSTSIEGEFVYPSDPEQVPPSGAGTCSEALCTFDRFGYSATYINYNLSGTITRRDTSLLFDLTASFLEHVPSMQWNIDGTVTVTADGIDGTLQHRGTGKAYVDGELTEVAWDVAADYDAVVLDAQGCPIGGAVNATARYDTPDSGYNVEGAAVFGPTCAGTL